MVTSPILVWFRRDLRLKDNPAISQAAALRRPVIPVFIWAPEEEKPWSMGAASRWWLHHSLEALDQDLRKVGSRLLLRSGPSLAVLQALVKETGATSVFWNRVYDPALIARDTLIKDSLRHDDLHVESGNSLLLFEPWTVKTQTGQPYQVFTPYWRACLAQPEPARPLEAPTRFLAPSFWPNSELLESWCLKPTVHWTAGLEKFWTPGERGAQARLKQFLPKAAAYHDERNRPDHSGTSRLSPHLHFGEIGPRQIWHALHRAITQGKQPGLFRGGETFLKEIGWREFAHHLLFHFPKTSEEPLNARFENFPWRADKKDLQAWQRGKTGFPMVDAGMREVWATGWMHNRVRMIAASFLVKDLGIHWLEGARWFWDTLVDADLANNTLGWQWVAGCGADAAPYYRVFNPALQAERFDPDEAYIKKWGPHEEAPIVDHNEARQRALMLFEKIKKR